MEFFVIIYLEQQIQIGKENKDTETWTRTEQAVNNKKGNGKRNVRYFPEGPKKHMI